MAASKGEQEAATAGSISVPTVFLLNIVAQVASILFEPFRQPGPEADAADRRSADNKPHLETVLGHPSLLRIGRKRLGEDKLKISVDQVSWIMEFTFGILPGHPVFSAANQ